MDMHFFSFTRFRRNNEISMFTKSNLSLLVINNEYIKTIKSRCDLSDWIAYLLNTSQLKSYNSLTKIDHDIVIFRLNVVFTSIQQSMY